jgi:hypothetical protein
MFLAHSVILSARSDFFKAAFSSVPWVAAVDFKHQKVEMSWDFVMGFHQQTMG